MHAAKDELRARFDAYRRSLSEAQYERLSARVIDRLITIAEVQEARVIHVYWPMIDRREIDTRSFIRTLRDEGKEIVLPVVVDFTRREGGESRLRHVRFPGEESLRVNRWGIAEPADHSAVPTERLEVVIVPALGAGRNGHRIGHGFGYYDEFLRDVSAWTIALVYDACLVDYVPAEPHDRPVDVIVTERESIRPNASSM